MNSQTMSAAEHIRTQIGALLPELRAFARFLARDRTEADDLVQETVLRALAALGQFQEGTSLRAWLFTILRRIHFEQGRRRRTERRLLDAQGPVPDGQPAPQDGQAALGELAKALWRLTPSLREALVLVGAQGLGYEEAAVICSVPVGTIKARVSRARAALAKQLGHDPANAET